MNILQGRVRGEKLHNFRGVTHVLYLVCSVALFATDTAVRCLPRGRVRKGWRQQWSIETELATQSSNLKPQPFHCI